MPQPPDLLTTQEVARLFDVTDRTVRRWVEKGKLVPYTQTPSGRDRFDAETVLTLKLGARAT